MRLNVTSPDGTGKEADVPGYRVGGKTGTADVAAHGGYSSKSVISSFLGAFPMDDPQYLTFIVLFEPKGTAETHGQHTAGYTRGAGDRPPHRAHRRSARRRADECRGKSMTSVASWP